MRQALLLSFAAHFALAALIVLAPLFGSNKIIDPNKVYRVSLVDLPGGLAQNTGKASRERAKTELGEKPKATAQKESKTKSAPEQKPKAHKESQKTKPAKAGEAEAKMKAPAARPPKETTRETSSTKREQKPPPKADEANRQTAERPAQEQKPQDKEAPQAAAQQGLLTIAKGPAAIGGAAPGGGLSFDSSIFPYPYYVRIIQWRITENWLLKDVEVLSGEVKKAIISFRITKDGAVEDAAVDQSSGVKLMDSSALRAVVVSSPFPPLPSDFNEDSLRVYIGFEFTGNG